MDVTPRPVPSRSPQHVGSRQPCPSPNPVMPMPHFSQGRGAAEMWGMAVPVRLSCPQGDAVRPGDGLPRLGGDPLTATTFRITDIVSLQCPAGWFGVF